MRIGRGGHRIAGAALLAMWMAFAPLPVDAADGPPPASAPAEPVVSPTIPLAEIATRAEQVITRLRGLVQDEKTRADLDRIEAELGESAANVWANLDDTQALLSEGPRLSVIEGAQAGWAEDRRHLEAQSALLTTRAENAERALAEVSTERDLWQRSSAAARDVAAPATVLARIDAVVQEIDRTRERILAYRERILLVQDQAARLVTISDEVMADLASHGRAAIEDFGVPSSRPLWHAGVRHADPGEAVRRLVTGTTRGLQHAGRFIERRAGVLRAQALLFFVLLVLFRAARSRAIGRAQRDPALRDALGVLEFPYSAALVITLISSIWLHAGLPSLLANAVLLVSFFPVLRILRRLVPPGLVWVLYSFAGFFFADRLRDFVAPVPLVEQLLLIVEMTAGLGFVAWVLRTRRLPEGTIGAGEARALRGFALSARLLGVAFAAALVAAVTGYMQIARVVAYAALGAVYTGMVLYAGVRAARGLTAYLLRVRPLSALRLVQRHRDLLEQRLGRGIGWTGIALWLFVIARNFTGLTASSAPFDDILAVDIDFGTVSISVGDVLALGVTILAAFVFSRFVRFVLDEEIYPRLSLAHGVPYAISSLVHYAILLGGFLLALTGMGLDLNKFTVLGGALGVGIGFGLQTIVNNFVSGLILLFERPVQIGDTIQVGDVTGDVKRIGIRSSTIRTWSGAEVIVPNSTLVSERVTNWTLSDRSRRFEFEVGVAYGTRPEAVIALMVEVAKKHPEVLVHPEPIALFVRFGDSSLDFELRAWVGDGVRLALVKSDVAVALTQAFETAGIEIPFPQRVVRLLEPRNA